jgi:hypothetical protein
VGRLSDGVGKLVARSACCGLVNNRKRNLAESRRLDVHSASHCVDCRSGLDHSPLPFQKVQHRRRGPKVPLRGRSRARALGTVPTEEKVVYGAEEN